MAQSKTIVEEAKEEIKKETNVTENENKEKEENENIDHAALNISDIDKDKKAAEEHKYDDIHTN